MTNKKQIINNSKSLNNFLLRLTNTSLIYVSGYVNMSTKATFKCPDCKEVFSQYTKDAINGRCVMRCKAKSMWSKHMIKKLKLLPKNIIVSGYNAHNFPLLECTLGHTMHDKTVSDVLRRGGCFTCLWDAAKLKRTTNYLSVEDATQQLLKANLKLISYNNTNVLEYECFKGHYKKLVTVKSSNLQNLVCRICQKHDTKTRELQAKVINATVVEYRGVKDATIHCSNCNCNYELSKKQPLIKCTKCYVNLNRTSDIELTKKFLSVGLTLLGRPDNNYLVKCVDKGHQFLRKHLNKWAGCKICAGKDRYTTPHRKLVEWLKLNNQKGYINKAGLLDEKRKEVDIYLPEHKLIIEIDGAYWHSEKHGEDSKKRIHRRKLVEDKGYRYLRFWDFEFNNPRPMLSYIHSVLKLNTKRVFARKCTVEKLDNDVATNFLNTWHLQGSTNASVKYGLFDTDRKLLAVMTFKRPHISKAYAWELARFCVKGGWSIPGGASKLFAAFRREHNPTSVVSYADKRYSEGNLYKHLNMTYSHTSNPGYFYIKGSTLISRYRAQKHKLHNLLEDFDPNLSEVLNMKANGYYRSFDCGQLIYYWGIKPTLTSKATEPSIVKERILNETHAGQLTWEYHANELIRLKIVKPKIGKLLRNKPLLYECTKCAIQYFLTPSKALLNDVAKCKGCENIELNKRSAGACGLPKFLEMLKKGNPHITYISGYTHATGIAKYRHNISGVEFECKSYNLISGVFPKGVLKLIKSKVYTDLLHKTWSTNFSLISEFNSSASILHNCKIHGNLYTRYLEVKERAAKLIYGCPKCNKENKKYIDGKWNYPKVK